jgi:hypothetical protein
MTTTVPEGDSYEKVDSVEVHKRPGDDLGVYEVLGVVNPDSPDEAVVCAANVQAILINGMVTPIVNGENDGNTPPLIIDEVSEETNLMLSFKGETVADIWIGDNLDG